MDRSQRIYYVLDRLRNCLYFSLSPLCIKIRPATLLAGFSFIRDKKMSWWEENTHQISESPFIVGFVVAIITSLLSTYRRSPKMRFMARITEALSCALLSLGLTKLGIFYLNFSSDMVISISVFVSWIGTSELKEALNRIFLKWLGSQSKHEDK